MTHYWWMHWFWITCHLSLCSIFTHSTPLTPISTVTSQLENQNLIDKTVITKQVTINITSSSTIKTLTTLCINMNITEMNCSDVSSTVTTMLPINSNTTDFESVSEYVTTNTTVIVTQQVSKELVSRNRTAESNWNAVSITGVSFGILVCAVFIAASSFLLYRRRYVNKPQTLNDKCSNPDSSGYIDDSTMRENSEEMYSLDNDSFLNSLEAMTIQNYWTDSVKHTKL